MKYRIFLLLIICLILYGCINKINTNYNVILSDSTSIKDYKEETINKMISLGKTVENKSLVIVEDSSDDTIYHIFTFENDECVSNEYYYFFTKDTANFDTIVKLYDEYDIDALWTKNISVPRDSTWEDLYNSYSYINSYTIVE